MAGIFRKIWGVDPLLSLAHTLVHCFKYLDQRNGTLKWRPSSTVDPFTNLKAHMPFICFYACICPCLYTHMPCTLMYLELVKKTLILGKLHFIFLHVLSLLLLTKHFHIVCLIWYSSQPVRLGRPAIASISQMKSLGLGQVVLLSLAQIHSPRLLVIKPRIESRVFLP